MKTHGTTILSKEPKSEPIIVGHYSERPIAAVSDSRPRTLKPSHVELERVVRPLLLYINGSPELLSLLYDMDLLPEQCEDGSRDWRNMLLLTEAWKNRQQWPNGGSERSQEAR